MRIFMENIRIAGHAIRRNKLRSLLTLFGIIIGILSVSLMGAALSGVSATFEKSMSFIGNDVLYIDRHPWIETEDDWWKYRNRPPIRERTCGKLMARAATLSFAALITTEYAPVTYRGRTIESAEIEGTTWAYPQAQRLDLTEGRFFSAVEDRVGARVAIIGHGVREALFPHESPVAKTIRIHGVPVRIIGCLKEQGKFMGLISMDKKVIVPLSAMKPFAPNWAENLVVAAKISPGKPLDDALHETRMIMRSIRGLKPSQEDNFSINRQEMFEAQLLKIRIAIASTGLGITALSLLVGGIGVMNIMFVSVKERTREIGIRKALGATRQVILGQFLMEAVAICLMGGLMGTGLTVVLVNTLDHWFVAGLSVNLVLLSLGVAGATGLLAGYVPARQAAGLNPIDAMRYE